MDCQPTNGLERSVVRVFANITAAELPENSKPGMVVKLSVTPDPMLRVFAQINDVPAAIGLKLIPGEENATVKPKSVLAAKFSVFT